MQFKPVDAEKNPMVLLPMNSFTEIPLSNWIFLKTASAFWIRRRRGLALRQRNTDKKTECYSQDVMNCLFRSKIHLAYSPCRTNKDVKRPCSICSSQASSSGNRRNSTADPGRQTP